MYPENRVLTIFGQEFEWPGLGPDGKFTNGSFTDPLVKPGMIPAGHLNLLTDVLTELIKDCGGVPDPARACRGKRPVRFC